jgi:N-acyl-D-aspartate/D-glutamate deacylase
MGERCYDDATPQDMAEMKRITREALEAGALGFSTSRFYGHLDKAGRLVPGTNASAEEMMTIGSAFEGIDHGTIEIISDWLSEPGELKWIEHIARTTRRTVTTLSVAGTGPVWDLAAKLGAEGLSLRPQVGARPASILMTLEGTINPMRQFLAYREIHERPLAERVAALRDPAFRARVLSEQPVLPNNRDAARMISDYPHIYPMDPALSYEPSADDSLAAIAARKGVSPVEVMMDAMADGVPLLVLFGNYPGDLESQRRALEHPQSVFGLSDGGAHCGVLVDASVPTYMLTYFTRDRVRGPHLPLELVVHKMTQDTARLYGLHDRGVLAAGYRADCNLIDYDALALEPPQMVRDLPAGGKRLIQRARGYVATVCAGEVTFEHGEATGALPGRLLRGAGKPA